MTPNPKLKLKNICEIAASHISVFASAEKSGLRKAAIPAPEPSRVMPRMKRITRRMIGRGIVILTTAPTLFTPFQIEKYIETHTRIRAKRRTGHIPPISPTLEDIWRTLLK